MMWLPLDRRRQGSALFRDYLHGRDVGVDFGLGAGERSFPAEAEFVARARARLGHAPTPELAADMRSLLQRHDASATCREWLDEVAAGRAVVVCTGQQPALGGGPLYSLHKAATAVAAAKRLRAAGVPAVAAFWIASDDADVHEASTAYVPGDDRRLVKATFGTGYPDGTMVGNIPASENVGAFRQLFGPGAEEGHGWAGESAARLVANTLGAVDLGDALAYLLLDTFADEGIVLVDSRMAGVRHAAEPVFRRYVDAADEVARRIDSAGDSMEAAGMKRPLHPKSAASAVFAVDDDGLRRKVDDPRAILDVDPARWSAGVVLRPFVQEAILPSAGLVAGPGELAYLLQTEACAEPLGVTRSSYVPRLGLTWVEPSLAALVAEAESSAEVGWRTLLREPGAFRDAALLRRVDPSLAGPLAALRGGVGSAFDELEAAAKRVDPNAHSVIDSAKRKVDFQLKRIEEQLLNGAKKRAKADGTVLANVESFLYPRKGLQERTFSVYWLFRHLEPGEVGARSVRAAEEFLDRAWAGTPGHGVAAAAEDMLDATFDYSGESWNENSASA